MSTLQKHYDVVIVGAGIQGLCAAHTFLTIDPSISLLIVDSQASVGGTWAKERVYPGLRANNLQGYFEFSDFPMLDANVGVSPQGIITGEAVSEYLQKYAEHFNILPHIRFNTKVLSATADNEEENWTLELSGLSIITCTKLLVATGQTSWPHYPNYPGMDKVQSTHTVDMASTGTQILNDDSVVDVTVIGSGKSAHDAVYRFASTEGKRVTWLMRKSGRGGLWMAKSYPQMGPFKVWLEGLLMTRPLSWFGACPWSAGDGFEGIRYLLHNTAAGRFITRNYFANMSQSTLDQSGILNTEETKKLIPRETLMWYGGQAAILHYDQDFYQLVGSKVRIIQEDIDRFDENKLILADGQHIQTDAVIYATGYKYGPSFPLLPITSQEKWGMPVSASHALDSKADAELFSRFPELKSSPFSSASYPARQDPSPPWRLWRFIAPPSQVVVGVPADGNNNNNNNNNILQRRRNLAFLTNVETFQSMLKAELVALWTYAYLHDELATAAAPASESDVWYEAVLWSRFGRWRCPMGAQGKTGDTLHDNMPYYDTLVRDLGLRSWRKGWGLLGELFGGAYRVSDYTGLVREWLAAREKKEKEPNREIM
jgi:cation diffusion facilitator CzcD-associated flavoprotein CzcO